MHFTHLARVQGHTHLALCICVFYHLQHLLFVSCWYLSSVITPFYPSPSLHAPLLPPSVQEIAQDGAVRVSTTKVFQAGQLSVVFYLTSMRQTTQDLTVSFTLPSSCQCSLDGAAVPNSTSVDVALTPFATVSDGVCVNIPVPARVRMWYMGTCVRVCTPVSLPLTLHLRTYVQYVFPPLPSPRLPSPSLPLPSSPVPEGGWSSPPPACPPNDDPL